MAVRNDNRSFIAGGIGIALIILTGVLRWNTPAPPVPMPPVVDLPGHPGKDTKLAEYYLYRADLRQKGGDLQGAISDFTKALEFDQESPTIYYNRACARYNLQAWPEALSDYEAAAAKLPSLRDGAQLRIFLVRSRAGRPEEAKEGIRTYLGTRLPSGGTAWPLESLRFAAGEVPEQDYLGRIPMSDGKPRAEQACEAYFLAGSLRLIQGDRAGAKELFSRSVATGTGSFPSVDGSRAELKSLEAVPPKHP